MLQENSQKHSVMRVLCFVLSEFTLSAVSPVASVTKCPRLSKDLGWGSDLSFKRC